MTDRQTDGRTDRQTEFSSLYCVCITCNAVKTTIKIVGYECVLYNICYVSSAADDCGSLYDDDDDDSYNEDNEDKFICLFVVCLLIYLFICV